MLMRRRRRRRRFSNHRARVIKCERCFGTRALAVGPVPVLMPLPVGQTIMKLDNCSTHTRNIGRCIRVGRGGLSTINGLSYNNLFKFTA